MKLQIQAAFAIESKNKFIGTPQKKLKILKDLFMVSGGWVHEDLDM